MTDVAGRRHVERKRLGPTILRVGLGVEPHDAVWAVGRGEQHAVFIATANLQLVRTFDHHRLGHQRVVDKIKQGRSRRCVGDHLTPLGVADDHVVDVPTFEAVVLPAPIVVKAIVPHGTVGGLTVVLVGCVAFQEVLVEQRSGVGHRMGVHVHQRLDLTARVVLALIELDRGFVQVVSSQRAIACVQRIEPVENGLRPGKLNDAVADVRAAYLPAGGAVQEVDRRGDLAGDQVRGGRACKPNPDQLRVDDACRQERRELERHLHGHAHVAQTGDRKRRPIQRSRSHRGRDVDLVG